MDTGTGLDKYTAKMYIMHVPVFP